MARDRKAQRQTRRQRQAHGKRQEGKQTMRCIARDRKAGRQEDRETDK